MLRILVDVVIILMGTAALLTALEGGLAAVGIGPGVAEDPYVGFSSWAPLFEPARGDSTGQFVETAAHKRGLFNTQRFSAKKNRDTYRIFCVGGSTTYGRPYDDRTSFSAWLRTMLPAVEPSRNWEVINAGGISYASYRVARLMEELSTYKPDMFVVYTGHNEFLEERTYRDVARVPRWAHHIGAAITETRLYAAARTVRTALGGNDSFSRYEKAILPAEVSAILDDTVGPESYHRDDVLRRAILAHLRTNLARMVTIATASGARVVFITPASNLREFSPFKSEHRAMMSKSQLIRFDTMHNQGEMALQQGRFDDAVNCFQECTRIDPRFAEAQFKLGEALWAARRFSEARNAFCAARDQDVCPLRAVSEIPELVRQCAREYGVPLVDFEEIVGRAAPHEVPGSDLFLDHVHPTIEAHGMLAEAILLTLREAGVVQMARPWDRSVVAHARATIEAMLDDSVRAQSLCNLAKVLGWAGKFDEAHRLATQAFALAPANAEPAYAMAVSAENIHDFDTSLRMLKITLDLNPLHPGALLRLGNVYSDQGNRTAAADCYQRLAESDPDRAHLGHNNLANELAALGKIDDAIAQYEAALNCRPGYAPAHGNLAMALAQRGRTAEATEHFRAAIRLDPNNGAYRYNFARHLLNEHRDAEAIDQLRNAVHLMPDYAPAHLRLALALEHIGHRSDALVHTRRALDLQPAYSDASRALARLQGVCEDSDG